MKITFLKILYIKFNVFTKQNMNGKTSRYYSGLTPIIIFEFTIDLTTGFLTLYRNKNPALLKVRDKT
ncbi:hypothetical protein AUL54_05750 [Bacillus sp. SDLI1]|uniref:Uncharacterized protein n=1 Tax=Bacillus siamensis TaxID=659243 RepID=A0AAI8N1B9_9BACI|nr:hypothetical protein AUL54_05750 [Bacillus sp. SDLI1]AUJ78388.1 hypothetical protein CWD84_16910 [Bacillus siamensis]